VENTCDLVMTFGSWSPWDSLGGWRSPVLCQYAWMSFDAEGPAHSLSVGAPRQLRHPGEASALTRRVRPFAWTVKAAREVLVRCDAT
jgi:hypothetical protein